MLFQVCLVPCPPAPPVRRPRLPPCPENGTNGSNLTNCTPANASNESYFFEDEFINDTNGTYFNLSPHNRTNASDFRSDGETFLEYTGPLCACPVPFFDPCAVEEPEPSPCEGNGSNGSNCTDGVTEIAPTPLRDLPSYVECVRHVSHCVNGTDATYRQNGTNGTWLKTSNATSGNCSDVTRAPEAADLVKLVEFPWITSTVEGECRDGALQIYAHPYWSREESPNAVHLVPQELG